MITHAIQKLYLIYPRYPEGGYHPPSLSSLTYFFVKFSLKVTIRHPLGECEATFSYLLMCFVPQFTEATYIIILESVIFSTRLCVYTHVYIKCRASSSNNIFYIEIHQCTIASSSNNIFYIEIHQFTQQTMLNQSIAVLHDTIS